MFLFLELLFLLNSIQMAHFHYLDHFLVGFGQHLTSIAISLSKSQILHWFLLAVALLSLYYDGLVQFHLNCKLTHTLVLSHETLKEKLI